MEVYFMNTKKVCCLYISTYHLFTIILPYINEKMNDGKEIELILQNDLSTDIERYVKNIRNLGISTEKILNLNWKKKNEILEKNENKIYVIVGDENFILNYEKILIENEIESELLGCYKMNNNLEISKVLLSHDYLLTTKRKKEIAKFSQNEQKRRTIKSQL